MQTPPRTGNLRTGSTGSTDLNATEEDKTCEYTQANHGHSTVPAVTIMVPTFARGDLQ